MKILLYLALVVSLFTPALAHADEAARRAKAEELISAMHGERMMQQMKPMLIAQTNRMLQSQAEGFDMTPEQRQIMTDYMTKVNAIAMEYVAWDRLKPMMIDVYASTYTEQELADITTFFKSPAGQAYLEKAPQMATAMMTRTMENLKDMMPRVQALAKEMSEKLKAATPAGSDSR